MPSQEFIDACLQYRGVVLTGKYAHWCHDWDGLPMDETCVMEWPCGCSFQEDVDAGLYDNFYLPDDMTPGGQE